MLVNINYQDIMTMILDDNNEPIQIKCNLPILGEGNNRRVYDLGNNLILKIATTAESSFINQAEINLYEKLKNRECDIHFNAIFEYDENAYWYVAEKIDMKHDAMNEALKIIPCLDCSDNAGYNKDGILTVVDAEYLHYTWFTKNHEK